MITGRGLCKIYDIIHNTMGTAIGVGIDTAIKRIALLKKVFSLQDSLMDQNLDKNERRLQILDIIVVIGLMTAGCFLDKHVMDNVSDTWVGFNGAVLGVLVIGGVIWWRI